MGGACDGDVLFWDYEGVGGYAAGAAFAVCAGAAEGWEAEEGGGGYGDL